MFPQDRIFEEMKVNDYLKRNTIYIDEELERSTQIKFCRQLEKLANQELEKPEDERKPIKVKISSFGGMVLSVFAMVSYMERIQEQGIIIETYCDGYVASGASKILMAGSKGHRYITRYGIVVFHQPNSIKHGHSTLQEDIKGLEDYKKDWETLKEMIRKHTEIPEDEIDSYTEKNIDFYYRPKEVVAFGIADHII